MNEPYGVLLKEYKRSNDRGTEMLNMIIGSKAITRVDIRPFDLCDSNDILLYQDQLFEGTLLKTIGKREWTNIKTSNRILSCSVVLRQYL
ncbi:hypothetical protein KY329_02265 [Candidatus Woesearchaeota archaeon]|nr:hypothetical protein [Candidatus Woesearchaeota archaeon]